MTKMKSVYDSIRNIMTEAASSDRGVVAEEMLYEYLTDKQRAKYSKVEMTPEARKATDHFFGQGNDHVREDIKGQDEENKSEVHKKIENHLGTNIDVHSYKKGVTKDKYGREVRLGKAIKDEKLRNEFAKDSTRAGVKSSHGHYCTVVRGTEVAGQTNSAPNAEHPNGHSWGQESCKNVDDGSNKKYLKHEVEHGTVAVRVHDHSGKEIYRATLQPHLNDAGHTAYALNSEYGVKHSNFTKHAKDVAKRLSGEHKGGSLAYNIHKKVYNDSPNSMTLHPGKSSIKDIGSLMNDKNSSVREYAVGHPKASGEVISKGLKDKNLTVRVTAISNPNATKEHIDQALKDKSPYIRTSAIENPNVTKEHIDKALKDENVWVRNSAANRRDLTKEHINVALKDEDMMIRRAAARHPNATKEHISMALKDKDGQVRMAAATNSNATKEHLDTALKDEAPVVRYAALHNPNITDKQLQKATKDDEHEHNQTTANNILKKRGNKMKSIYESIRSIMTEGGATGYKAQSNQTKDDGPLMKKFIPSLYDKDRNSTPSQSFPVSVDTNRPKTTTNLGNASASKDGSFGNPKTSNPLIASQRDKIASQLKSGERQSATAMPPGRRGPGSSEEMPKKADLPQPNAVKPAAKKDYSSDIASARAADKKQQSATPRGDQSAGGKTNADFVPSSKKPEAATPGSDKAGIAFKQNVGSSAGTPSLQPKADIKDSPFGKYAQKADGQNTTTSAEPKPANVDDAATKARDSLKGQEAPRDNTVQRSPEADKFVTKTYTKPDSEIPQADTKPEKDTTVRSSSGEPVKTGSGGTLKTDTDDEIANRGPFGISKNKPAKKEVNVEQFGVTKSTVDTVMEVLKKSNVQGSKPTNDREKDLAAMHGNPNRITHGDVLKARGVTMKTSPGKARGEAEYKNVKEEEYQIDELKKSTIASYIQKKFGKMSDEPVSKNQYGYAKKDAKGIRSAGLRMSGIKATQKEEVEEENVQEMSSKMKMKLGLYGKKKSMKENKDTPGNGYEHQCAIHVKSESFGEGRTITTQHADPDADGNIAWYDVMFEHGIEKGIPTTELEILVSESHMHSMKKKKKM